MLLRLENGKYLDTSSGTAFAVTGDPAVANSWVVQVGNSNWRALAVTNTIRGGYATRDEAQGVLDELMQGEDYKEIQAPSTPEERGDVLSTRTKAVITDKGSKAKE